jgi:hypothetical protein
VRRDQCVFDTNLVNDLRKEIERKLELNWFSLALRRKDKLEDDVSVCAHLCETKVEVGQDRIPSLHEKVRQSPPSISSTSFSL